MRALLMMVVALGGCSSFSGTGEVPGPGPGGGDAGAGGMDAAVAADASTDTGAPTGDPDTGMAPDPDAGMAPVDAGPPTSRDAGPPPPPPRAVPCGEDSCTGVEACCVTSRGSRCIASRTAECNCPDIFCDSMVVECDGPTDCPAGRICCASTGLGRGSTERITCEESCSTDLLNTRAEVCIDGDGIECSNHGDCVEMFWLPRGFQGCSS